MFLGKLATRSVCCMLFAIAVGVVAASPAAAMMIHYETSESHIGLLASGLEYSYSTTDDSRFGPILGKAKLLTQSIETGGTTFQGVHIGEQSCNTTGEPAGVVKTHPTTLELGWISRKSKTVGLEERPTSGTAYAEYTCGKDTIELRGAHIGVLGGINKTISPGQFVTDEVSISETGRDSVLRFEGGPETFLEAQVDGGGFHEVAIADPGRIGVEEGTFKVKASGKGPPEFLIKEKAKKGK
jgi:hypothetical protein